ncbi:unnamed protein product [Caenorhabditis angaria]|uniref:glutathione transferase n=1 Tax=Caenorhabditis angaria TaxID=860376 RepID=A0A9P1MYZ6_9PELO|nr:unnamed protein product [Caenorhabditis angaria]
MVSYKLTYFQSRGLAEVSRQLFHLADVQFENHVVDRDEFLRLKPSLPFGQVPLLTVDGVEIPQSLAVARYLARKFGFAGKTAEEEAIVDALGDQFKDFYKEIHDYFYAKLGIIDVQVNEDTHLIPARNNFLTILTNFLQKSQSEFLVDSGLTYADLIIIDNMTTLIGWYPDYLDGFDKIQKWRASVLNFPKLKEYLEKRPLTPA